ncbi:hypothetical protein [Paenibacillus thalictri]|uniref:Uncharacterized protein n=1 Tax=Paenibacillus thalictri TaxID=2527873 RepID=A0A4Q9DY71_9BACL|nr:hypothetical protein [Paenibacillus thalictri]TBL80843.1 hypothetical protein EYB31_06395 [Paenibacillus thalictri]
MTRKNLEDADVPALEFSEPLQPYTEQVLGFGRGDGWDNDFYREVKETMAENQDMDETGIPYWLWTRLQAKPVCSRQIGSGEVFVALLDRLDAFGIDIGGVTEEFANLADSAACMDGEELEGGEARCGDQIGRLGRFAVLLRTRSGEREYEALRGLAGKLFAIIGEVNERTRLSPVGSEPFDRSASKLLQTLEHTMGLFRTKVLNSHASYFKPYSSYEPVHLGYMVYSVQLLEQWIERLRIRLSKPAAAFPEETFYLKPGLFCDLLDWTGDAADLEYFHWRREFNEIAGVEET